MSFHDEMMESLKANGSGPSAVERDSQASFPMSLCTDMEATVKARKALRKATRSGAEPEVVEELTSRVKKCSRRVVQRRKRTLKQKQLRVMRELESLQWAYPKEMWHRLKAQSGDKREKRGKNAAVDEKGNEVTSEEEIKEVWAHASEKLGEDDPNDPRFDRQFYEQVKKEIEEHIDAETVDEEEELAFNRWIERDEMEMQVKRMVKGKAVGGDERAAELLKHGGEVAIDVAWRFARYLFMKERYPEQWMKGKVCPLYKDGDERDPLNYRGITLLSVIGKLFTAVMTKRLSDWAEEEGILVDEQGGFRPKRGCPDQIFALSEVIAGRGSKSTFACFVDLKKAFDRVWRDGLWKALWDEGVRGKMWRMLRAMYAVVGSSVLSPAGETRFFGLDVGVRQGCALSPLLFAIFINSLAKRVKNKKVRKGKRVKAKNEKREKRSLGVEVPDRKERVCILLYADDIVLLAQSAKDLQALMDVVTKHGRKWRYECNKKKSQVMVFGAAGSPRWARARKPWKLGGNTIKEVNKYKYLGIWFERCNTARFRESKTKMVQAARRKMRAAWGMGVRGGVCTAKLSSLIWKSLVRPTVESAAEVIGAGKWPEADNVQLEMGKKILRTGKHTCNAAVRGEMGWWTLEARRDQLRLGFWRRLVLMDDSRLTKQMYKQCKKREGAWAKITQATLEKLGLGHRWETEDVPESKLEWKKVCKEALQLREERKWQEELEASPKLDTYRIFKKKLEMEPYLQQTELNLRARLMRWGLARIRTGSNELQVDKGRQIRPHVPRDERVCLVCNNGTVEDEAHFLLQCEAYASLRDTLQASIAKIPGRFTDVKLSSANKVEALKTLLGGNATGLMSGHVGTFIVDAMKIRRTALAAARSAKGA
jgi:hypothetical protein